jgi:hypothetical protein
MNDHIWTPAGTDITIRWRKAGWVPPSEQPVYQAKWKFWQELPMRKLNENEKVVYEDTLRRNKVARIK